MKHIVRRAFIYGACLISLLTCLPAQADQASSPEEVMKTFLNAFVSSDYATCQSLLTEDATLTIIRQDGGPDYIHSIQPAHDWLENVGEQGVKHLETFEVDILEALTTHHNHGATVVLKFSANGRAEHFTFRSEGFDTGNLIETPLGWRILHYSSFERFDTLTAP